MKAAVAAPHFGLEFAVHAPLFRGEVGDRLIVRVGHPEPVVLCRVLSPNLRAVATALDLGHLRPLNPRYTPEDVIRQLDRSWAAYPLQLVRGGLS